MPCHYFKWPPLIVFTSLWFAHGILYVHEAHLLVGFCGSFWRVFEVPVTHLQLLCWFLYDAYANHNWCKKSHCKLRFKLPVMAVVHRTSIYRHTRSFSTIGSILDMERTCRRPVLNEEKWTEFVVNGDIPKKICGKWGYSKENLW